MQPRVHGNETILLVEDEPTILNMTTTILQRLGYKVLGAGTPSEAIRLADDHSVEIHLLLTDVIMPEMNGKILTEKLTINRPELKCLFMSGYTANVISHHGVLEDGVHFIQKPFAKAN
jgi:two-component system, cell cycle sensor histidine kinase and response regulator CckA